MAPTTIKSSIQTHPSRFVFRVAILLSVLSIVAVALLRQIQSYKCWSQTCTERAKYAYENLVTVWTFYAWLAVTTGAVYFAQRWEWGSITVFKIGNYRISRLRLLAILAPLLLQVLIFAYWWDAANRMRYAAKVAELANPSPAGGHHHRRHAAEHGQGSSSSNGTMTGADIMHIDIPFTFDIFCSNMFRAAAHPVAVQLALTLLPVSRQGILSSLLKIDYDTSLEFHRWSGTLVVIFGLLHGSGHELPGYIKKGFVAQLENRFKPAENYRGAVVLTGYVTVFVFLWVGLNSFPRLRRANFSWFYINHLLAWVAIAMSFIHASPMLYLALPAVLFYMVDAAVRVYNRSNTCHITSVKLEECGYLRVEIAGWNVPYQPGQWISLKIPALSKTMWHPFTIASSYGPSASSTDPVIPVQVIHDEYLVTDKNGGAKKTTYKKSRDIIFGSDTITLVIKPTAREGRWTSSLLRLWERSRDNEGFCPIKVFIDGPHGTFPPRFLSSPHIITIAGGSGIPGALSIANHVLDSNTSQSVDFVWTAREAGAERLSSLQDLQRHNILQTAGHHSCSFNLSADGRLDINDKMRRMLERFSDADSVSVYTCGPTSLTDAVVDAVNVCRKGRRGRIMVHTEGYER
ncbi:hypothetical protein PhCBS80983_g05556 [Powellomyces hirtus]|uniref:FAD-binding FR-type domain-containing protein n=1 Tax=Powellomyces hirtus TaxID=109895 RepID=A0A507DUL3_9FUNG|nr:hypothetical protein PhCBS80983_g05556 [Powellomyces hirtus]